LQPRVGFVAPYQELAEFASQVCQDLGLTIEIKTGDLDEGVKIAQAMVADGAEVIISRGGTATDIASHIKVPGSGSGNKRF
jgi:hypothetical protein